MIQLTGTIFKILPPETFESGFRKQVMILKTDDQRAQHHGIDFINDDDQKLDGFQGGDRVEVSVNMWGNLSKDTKKAYTSLQAYQIRKLDT